MKIKIFLLSILLVFSFVVYGQTLKFENLDHKYMFDLSNDLLHNIKIMGSGFTKKVMSVKGQKFSDALQVTISQKALKPWKQQVKIEYTKPIKNNDILLLSVYARCFKTEDETGIGKFSILHKKPFVKGEKWEAPLLQKMINVGDQWEHILIPYKATKDYPFSSIQLLFGGSTPEIIEVANLKIFNFGKKYSFSQLPISRIMHFGIVTNAKWRKTTKEKVIYPNNSLIKYRGLKYLKYTNNIMIFNRFSEAVLNCPTVDRGFNAQKARSTTGGIIEFKSDSPTITFHFTILPNSFNNGSQFGVYQDGKWDKFYNFNRTESHLSFTVQSHNPGHLVHYEIVLPSLSNPIFQGLEIKKSSKLVLLKDEKKVYVAIGDSITHGVGQDSSSFLTYPFLLSRKLNYELYNLAVSGGKISVPTGGMLKDWSKIDLITILIGYNDLHSNGKSVEQYKQYYQKLIIAIRKNHKTTPIFCISPTYTKKPISEKTGINIKEYRKAVAQIVKENQKNGDKNVYLIKGEAITSEKNLRTTKPDPVHFGKTGARMFAEKLYTIINKKINH